MFFKAMAGIEAAFAMQVGFKAVWPYLLGGLIAGLIFAVITIVSKKAVPFTAPLYALSEGFFLGGISAVFEAKYGGIVIQAVAMTFGVLFALLLAYTTRLIKPSENFKLGI